MDSVKRRHSKQKTNNRSRRHRRHIDAIGFIEGRLGCGGASRTLELPRGRNGSARKHGSSEESRSHHCPLRISSRGWAAAPGPEEDAEETVLQIQEDGEA